MEAFGLALPDLATATKESRPDVMTGSIGFHTDEEFRDMEKSNITSALRHANWQIWGKNGAAQLLGVKPSTLTYRMKVFGIEKDSLSRMK